ncbi:hypothetical protein MTO96_020634 [Rhipicephalus appendiculatus]
MRMKASLGMVGEFCTMIQATGEQRSWHTAIWTGRLRDETRAFGASDDPVSDIVWRDCSCTEQALMAARDVILVAARTGRVAQPMASRQRTLLRRHPSGRRRGREEHEECLTKRHNFWCRVVGGPSLRRANRNIGNRIREDEEERVRRPTDRNETLGCLLQCP